MFDKIKSIFKKEEKFACIVWDGKKMSYPFLTQKQIDEINKDPENKGSFAKLKEEY